MRPHQECSFQIQNSFNSSNQVLILECGIMALAVDGKRWCAVDTAASSAGKIGADPWHKLTLLKSHEQV